MEMEVEGDVGKGALQTKDGVGRDTGSLKGYGKKSVFGTRPNPMSTAWIWKITIPTHEGKMKL